MDYHIYQELRNIVEILYECLPGPCTLHFQSAFLSCGWCPLRMVGQKEEISTVGGAKATNRQASSLLNSSRDSNETKEDETDRQCYPLGYVVRRKADRLSLVGQCPIHPDGPLRMFTDGHTHYFAITISFTK